MIIPSYRKSWAHEVIQMPSTIIEKTTSPIKLQTIDLIYFRKKYKNEKPNLLEYPWLLHEMGHYLISRYGESLFKLLIPSLNRVVNSLKLRALADRGTARSFSNETIDEIQKMWNPLNKDSRWTEEIAIDLLGLWTCGPAYLNAYYTDHQDANPFLLQLSHPPVAIRTHALIESATKLGWNSYISELGLFLDNLEKNISVSERNKYKVLRDKGLIDEYLNKTSEYYSGLNIPRLTEKDIQRISNQNIDIELPSFATDLIVKAWLVYQENDETAFQAWEENIVNDITEQVTQ